MIDPPAILRWALGTAAAGTAAAVVAWAFAAYLDPSVFLPALGVLAWCG